ncbi:MAG: sensor histidine kinase [Bacteroidales bacterium]|nr:sensor histidine kinase [Bacteroidales bacterium]MCF8399378.1 sensor histidine kinase [Bacteroidales bacterium]
MKKVPFILFLILSFLRLDAENNDSTKVWSWFDAFLESSKNDLDQSKLYLDSIKYYLQDNPGQKAESAEYQKMMGIYQYRMNNMDSSIYYYKESGETYRKLGNQLEEAKTLVNLSISYNRQAEYEKTIQYAIDALRIFERLNDRKGISIANNIIGQVYFFTDEYANARKYFRKYLQNAIAASDSMEIGSGYNNLGSVFLEEGKEDSALYYHLKATKFAEATNNLFGLSNAYQNIAAVYQKKQNTGKSLEFYKKALLLSRQLNDANSIAMINLNIGRTYNDQDKFTKALPYLKKSLKDSYILENLQLINDNLKSLSIAWEGLNDYQKSLDYYKRYDSLSDSLLNEKNRSNIEEINVKYETEKKDRQIEQQEASLKEKDLTIQRNIVLIIGLVLLVILISSLYYFLHNRYKLKQRALLQEEKARMKEAQIKAVVESQEEERQRFATDLHDGMGQLISALGLNIQSMRKFNKKDPAKAEELSQHSTEILDEIHDEIRNIAFNLMPKVLVKEGLIAATRALAKKINKSGEIKVETCVFDIDDRFQEKSAISLYRIIQEFLSNIMKYSGAKTAGIQFTGYDTEIVLTIEDDGMGFDLENFKNSEGNGWRNVNTRLEMLNAQIEIDTMEGRKNSTVIITIPKHGNLKL